MKFTGFDGRVHTLSSKSYLVYGDTTKQVSKLHAKTRVFLKELFPNHLILEEVTLPGSKVSGVCSYLRLDFLLPQLDLAVEVHGEQHYKFTDIYHKDINDYRIAVKRDKYKIEWCELNKLTIVELKYNESIDEWRETIRKSIYN